MHNILFIIIIMNYVKYKKYKTKYLDLLEKKYFGGDLSSRVQFILFGDVMTGDQVWFSDMNGNKNDFVEKLEKIGDVIILKPNYINFMKYSKEKDKRQN